MEVPLPNLELQGENQEGASPFQFTIKNGLDICTAFGISVLKPILKTLLT